MELEKSQYQQVTTVKGFGFGGATGGFVLDGATSSVRITSAPDLAFVIKVNPGTDPTSVVDSLAFTIDKGRRLIITTKAGLSWSKTTIVKLAFQVKKITDVYVRN